ncbi:hypothetical protein BDV38DRAFT_280173 [Aspergillus pseudotamarii]|uniref:Polyketide synthase n=1 Tax=Aspergillus pseudotamarii TaxID=132259 RepID=A0A5N6SZR2_ASPPS|nr:uncharacterized protein BDV38DRAFT_280173 [Aspergillus pseudotamarii]KAE8140176.1 hypothetical protein BDV38DRAFT_280173 [Aspergillus pseudotamarii]
MASLPTDENVASTGLCLDHCQSDNSPTSTLTNGNHRPEIAHQVPIAICGMSTRLPGGLNSPQELWKFLLAKGDARGPVPKSRYNLSAHYSDKSKPSTVITEHGYFLDDSIDISTIDTSGFNMKKSEVERTDPQQRQMLEVARECLEDAGETNWKGRPIGCYMGSFGEDWLEMFAKDPQQYGLYRVTGYGDFMLPNRVSYEMDLTGPSLTVRTGCSAALVALHEACMGVSRGDCEAAIVGGANLIMGPGMSSAMSEQAVIAPDGSCKSFSADANGYARAEAISAIFIKPLSSAIRDNNPVRAVIRGTATNCDGKGTAAGIQVPNEYTQEALIRHTYKMAGITNLSETAFVECHGTGTQIGDPVETAAVGRVFGPVGGIQIGSVKPNLGHSEGASGLTSLIKAVMMLDHRIIPPNIKFNEPNPKIPWGSCGLSVPTEPMAWPENRRERVSVNSFGIGGSNAHVVLDSARSHGVLPIPTRPLVSPELLVYSANTAESLERMITTYKAWVQKNPDRLVDLAYTLGNHREHLPYRAFAVADLFGSLTPSLPLKAGKPPNVVMVFSGQGAQWPEMGRCLLLSSAFPIFRKTIQSLDAHLRTLSHTDEWTIEDELQQPASCCCRHSSGEIAAAYAIGAISAFEAIAISFYRGKVTSLQPKKGAMAAVGLGSNDVQAYLEPGVVVACQNSPQSTTLAGDTDMVQRVIARIKEAKPDILTRLLHVDKAYHSHHMEEIGDYYYAMIKDKVSPNTPITPFFSTVTGKQLTPDTILDGTYWKRNLESPVLFHSAISSIMKLDLAKNMVMLEVGPHSALAGPIRQIQADHSDSSPYVSALTRNQNDVESFLRAIGTLHCLNVSLELEKVITKASCLPDLPRYPWDHSQSFWYESRLSKEWRHRQHAHHDLLGVRVVESTDSHVLFRNVFHLESASWVRDHKVGEDIVFPFAGYAAMIGEAIRQVTGINESFTLRKVTINAALVLNEGHPVEVNTALIRHKLTDTLDSEWWGFTIASHNGTAWTTHCSGDVSAHSGGLGCGKRDKPLVRKVPTRRCYEAVARAGLNFGPAFQRLHDIRFDTTTTNTTSEVSAKLDDGLGYHIHPTVIDALLQLITIAPSKGFVNTTTKTTVPTAIEEMCIARCSDDIQVQAFASETQYGSIIGAGKCVTSDGKVVLRSSGVKLSVLDEQAYGERDETTAREEWGPHIDFLDAQTLIKPAMDRSVHMPLIEELVRLCTVQTRRTIAGLETPVDHMYKYKSWIERQREADDIQCLEYLDSVAIEFRVAQILNDLSQTPAASAAVGVQVVCQNIQDIFTGNVDALDVLLVDDMLAKLYVYLDQADESQLLKYLTHSKPDLRVLEIGAGTGGSTATILKLLTPGGEARYSRYTYTDISAGFFVAAKERFSNFPHMEFLPLDISKDPSEQGFNGRKYDLILASNVLHATKSLNETLCNVHKLLDPNGRLLLHELTTVSRWPNYIWGTLAGWWYGEADGRPDQPYINIDRWTAELRAAGFCAPDAAIPDSDVPHQLNTIILARPEARAMPMKRATLLRFSESKNVRSVVKSFENRGYTIDQRGPQEDVPVGQDVISLLEEDGPFFENISDRQLEDFQALAGKLNECGILWITAVSQVQCQDPRFGQTIGIARVMRSEMLIDFATCEVDNISSSADRIVDVFEKFQRRQEHDGFISDLEYTITDNTVSVPRINSFSLQDELPNFEMGESNIALRTNHPGRLAALHWEQTSLRTLKDGDVEVEIHAAGLNFKDVLVAMGIVQNPGSGFGVEGAGIVRRTGAAVQELNLGDRVMVMSNSIFATRVVLSENFCVKIPSGLSFEDAATMPCVFATVIYSIFHIGNLKRGQSILIHSACGGIGLATISLARMAGAEIYTTVGNEEKVKFLMDNLGIPRNRIFNSRNTSFVEDIMRETDNQGVDLALNSLSGELLHATWRCIAPFGKMVEIGKRDLLGSGKLDMQPFLENRSYCSVDLDQIGLRKPTLTKELLKETVHLLKECHIQPIRPIKTFDCHRILDAFRYMEQGVHMGKIVVSMRNAAAEVTLNTQTVTKQSRNNQLDSSAAYLLVGGLGGLGRAIASRMVERGARHLIFLSRSAGATKTHWDLSLELSSMGCRADFVQGSVLNVDDVTKAINYAHGRLKGVLQMSMVLRDNSFPRMTKVEWDTSVDPKVKGTWNLHSAALSINAALDFFVLFSSLSGIVGQPGQANYAGANTFLDAFAKYRWHLGLPACAIQIGAVEGVGYVAENPSLVGRSTHSEIKVSEQELLGAVEAAMKSTSRSFCLGIHSNMFLGMPEERSTWKRDIRMAAFHQARDLGPSAESSSKTGLRSFVAKAKADPALLGQTESAPFLAREIGKKVFSFLLKPEEDLRTSCSLTELGMDSLVAIEVRQWWKSIFGFDISVLEMMGMGTLDNLGAHAARGMLRLFHGVEA